MAPSVAIATVIALVLAAALFEAGAGAARAPAASLAGLEGLWWSWATRLPWALGITLTGAGLVELGFARRRHWRLLHTTREQAKELQRREGVA
jgi:hypothetical protein